MPSLIQPSSSTDLTAPLQAVLDFWFLAETDPAYGQRRIEWFSKSPEFDATIRQQFGDLVEQALADDRGASDKSIVAGAAASRENVPPATGSPLAILAQIIVLDQFTRNIYRDTPRAFAGDTRALALAQSLVATRADQQLLPMHRSFAYLPFEHSEDLTIQDQAVALFTQLHEETGDGEIELDYAIRHRDVIAQFQRFPHRNHILGRTSSAEETVFLTLPGAHF